MPIEWTTQLAVGNDVIDEQHQELFRRFNTFLISCKQASAKDQIEPLFDFLDSYIKEHFHQEEMLMAAHRYPLLAEHRIAHRHFIERMSDLRLTLTREGASSTLVINTNQALLEWIVTHIKQVDKRFGAFLQYGTLPGTP